MRGIHHGYAEEKRRSIAAQATAAGPLPVLPDALMDELVKGPMTPSEGKGLMLVFNKAIVERAMGTQMNIHLSYRLSESRTTRTTVSAARRSSPITARRESICPVIAMAVFAPILIPKHERRFTGFDERIIAIEHSRRQVSLTGLWLYDRDTHLPDEKCSSVILMPGYAACIGGDLGIASC